MIRTRHFVNVYSENYKPVNPHLAVTPVDMENMTNKGRSVSTAALENFVYYNGDMLDGLPLDMVRGSDMNDVWEAAQTAKGKVNRLRTKRARELHDMQMRQQEKGGE